MPCLTIALFPGAVLSRVVRVGLQEVMARPFATTGFAKGYGRSGVLLREALPNIAVPYLTTFGAQFTLMIIGSIVVETVFALKRRRRVLHRGDPVPRFRLDAGDPADLHRVLCVR